MRKFIATIFLIMLWVCPAHAVEIKEVLAVGPSWEKFTNRDGTGLYHEILRTVFDLYDIPVRRLYVTSQRGNDLVAQGRADIMTCRDRAPAPLMLAKHPMYEGNYHVFFNRSLHGVWKGAEQLAGKRVVFRKGYYSKKNFAVPVVEKEVKTGLAALTMVLLQDADYYVDDVNFIKDTIKESKIPFVREDYTIEVAGFRQYRPVMLNSERGRAIMKLYDEGMHTLYKNGTLHAIFAKWGFQFPHYSFDK